MEKQTAGRNQLGEFAPKFAELNDDVLFGEVWSREDKLSLRDRSMITVAGFIGKGMIDNSFKHHIMNAKKNGVTKEEMAEIIGIYITLQKMEVKYLYVLMEKVGTKKKVNQHKA